MAERTNTTSTSEPWPTWRDALSYRLGYLQATVDFHNMRKPSSGDGWMQTIKLWMERYELASKLWALRRPAGLTLLIASWWEHILWLLRHIVG